MLQEAFFSLVCGHSGISEEREISSCTEGSDCASVSAFSAKPLYILFRSSHTGKASPRKGLYLLIQEVRTEALWFFARNSFALLLAIKHFMDWQNIRRSNCDSSHEATN